MGKGEIGELHRVTFSEKIDEEVLHSAASCVKVMFSKDMGETWDTDEYFIYNNGGNSSDLGYPASIELPDGDILTVFYAKDMVYEAFKGGEDYQVSGPAVIKQQIWNFEE